MQMPFLALLQCAGVVVEDGHKRDASFARAANLDLLESCITRAAAGDPVALHPATRRGEAEEAAKAEDGRRATAGEAQETEEADSLLE